MNSVVLSGSTTPTLAVTGTSSVSGSNTGDQTITLTGAVTGSGVGSFATTIATPGTLTVSSTNSTATAHTHAITSSSAPGIAASLLATDASGIIGSTGTRIVKGWFTDLTVTNAIAGSVTGNAATVTTNANLTGGVTSVGNVATVVTNANLTGVITSVGNATSITSQTGTGSKFVVDTTPTLVTPVLGVATATSINKVTITAPATSATLTLVTGSSLITAGAFALTLTSTAASNATIPSGTNTLYSTKSASITSAQLATSLSDETGTGSNVFATSPTLVTPVISSIVNTGTLTLPTSTDTLVGRATTDTLTNKTLTTPIVDQFNTASGLGAAYNTSWSPAYTSSGGTPTTVTTNKAVYKQFGKMVAARLDFTITTVGTATGHIEFTLPVTALDTSNAGTGVEIAATGFAGSVWVKTTAKGAVTTYSGTSGWVAGYRWIVSLVYEVA